MTRGFGSRAVRDYMSNGCGRGTCNQSDTDSIRVFECGNGDYRITGKGIGHVKKGEKLFTQANFFRTSHTYTWGVFSNTCNHVTKLAGNFTGLIMTGTYAVTDGVETCDQTCNHCNQEETWMGQGRGGTYKTTRGAGHRVLINVIIGSYLKGDDGSERSIDQGVGVAPLREKFFEARPLSFPKSEILDRSETLAHTGTANHVAA